MDNGQHKEDTMIERMTIEAREIRPGDRLYDKDGPEVASKDQGWGGVYLRGEFVGTWEGYEVFTTDDPFGQPAATFGYEQEVTVWREVSR